MSSIKAPISILRLNEKTKEYIFDEKRFASIFIRPEIADLPIAVVSIVGDFRKGKSFLLNFFLRYLQRYDQENWLGDYDEPLTGFTWRQGLDRDTIGIVIWPDPLIITRKDGKKIAVILMDTQGFFDDKTSHDDCANFYAISSMISSIQIYNQRSNLQSNDVDLLSRFSAFAKEIKDVSKYKAFQKLLILIRDWVAETEYSYGADGGRKFLEYKKENQKDIFKESWDTLHNCYDQIDGFLMPHPGTIVNKNVFDGELSKLDPEFVENLRGLIPSLLSPETIVTKTWLGKIQKAPDILNLFMTLVEILKRHNCIKVCDLKEISYEAFLETTGRRAFAKFLDIYLDLNPLGNPEKVIESVSEARSQALQSYQEETNHLVDREMVKDFENSTLKSIDLFAKVKLFRESGESEQKNQDGNSWLQKAWHGFIYNVSTPILGKVLLVIEPYILEKCFAKAKAYSQMRQNNRRK